jgi:membrane protein DedA with SNARE-associated domain
VRRAGDMAGEDGTLIARGEVGAIFRASVEWLGELTAAMLLAVSATGGPLPYVALFLVMVVSGAGIPAIGTAALGAAAVLASQNKLSIDAVIAVACVGATLGGVIGYVVGRRWGVDLMERPGRWEEQRKKTLEQGHKIYRRWGWLACFVIPSYVAGVARMSIVMFLIFGTIAAVAHMFATAVPAYGAGKVASGHHDIVSILELACGLALIALIAWRARVRRRAAHDESAAAGAIVAATAPGTSDRSGKPR